MLILKSNESWYKIVDKKNRKDDYSQQFSTHIGVLLKHRQASVKQRKKAYIPTFFRSCKALCKAASIPKILKKQRKNTQGIPNELGFSVNFSLNKQKHI